MRRSLERIATGLRRVRCAAARRCHPKPWASNQIVDALRAVERRVRRKTSSCPHATVTTIPVRLTTDAQRREEAPAARPTPTKKLCRSTARLRADDALQKDVNEIVEVPATAARFIASASATSVARGVRQPADELAVQAEEVDQTRQPSEIPAVPFPAQVGRRVFQHEERGALRRRWLPPARSSRVVGRRARGQDGAAVAVAMFLEQRLHGGRARPRAASPLRTPTHGIESPRIVGRPSLMSRPCPRATAAS